MQEGIVSGRVVTQSTTKSDAWRSKTFAREHWTRIWRWAVIIKSACRAGTRLES
jgi:hypothetical protein